MKEFHLVRTEYRFACLIWENEPIGSGKLVALCAQELGWKKSTTYTVLKKLCERGFFMSSGAVVTACISRERYHQLQSEELVEESFGGSLPHFLTAFMGGKKLSAKQADELRALIANYQDEEH